MRVGMARWVEGMTWEGVVWWCRFARRCASAVGGTPPQAHAEPKAMLQRAQAASPNENAGRRRARG